MLLVGIDTVLNSFGIDQWEEQKTKQIEEKTITTFRANKKFYKERKYNQNPLSICIELWKIIS